MPQRTTQERYREKLRLLATEARAWEGIHRCVTESVEFLLDGRHYEDDDPEKPKDSTEIRWVGEEAFDRYRHEIAAVTEPGSLTARPVDQEGDPDLAEIATKLVLSETENPAKEWEDNWEDVVGAGSAAGYGVAWLDYLPSEGPWGEILLSSDDPRNFMCDRRIKSVHSPRCRFVIRRIRLTKGEARRRAQGNGAWDKELVEQLRSDDGQDLGALDRMANRNDGKPWVELGKGSPVGDENEDDKEFTAYIIWERNPDDTEEERDYADLEAGDRYMRCKSCGYRSESQSMLQSKGKLEGDLPEELQGGCPECIDSREIDKLGDMERIDGEESRIEMLAYPRGYMCILAPYALPGVEDFLYEGPWPFKLRSYPCTFLPRFRHPFKIVGPSLASITGWNQIATDMLMRLALERMVASAPAWLLPSDGLLDARGAVFEMSAENGWKAFYQGDSPPSVTMIGGDDTIPAAWNQTYQAARNALSAHSGRADFGLTDNQSRNIPASSVALQVRQEEIPIEHYKKRYQRQRGLLIGVLYDMMRAVYPAERLYSMFGEGADAAEIVRAMAISDMPNFNFHFDTTPDFRPQDEAQAKALELLLATMEARPWAVDLVAQVNKFSPSLVRKARQSFQQFQQQQMQAAQAQAQQAQAMGGMGGGAPVAAGQQQSPSQMVESLLAGRR